MTDKENQLPEIEPNQYGDNSEGTGLPDYSVEDDGLPSYAPKDAEEPSSLPPVSPVQGDDSADSLSPMEKSSTALPVSDSGFSKIDDNDKEDLLVADGSLEKELNKFNKDDSEKSKKAIVIAVASSLALLAIGGLTYVGIENDFFASNRDDKVPSVIADPGDVEEEESKDDGRFTEDGEYISEVLEEGDGDYPVTPSLHVSSNHEILGAKERESLMEEVKSSQLNSAASKFSSLENGFTSDPNQKYVDGDTSNLNDYYDPIIKEEIMFKIGNITNRLVDPHYGGWQKMQDPDSPITAENLNYEPFYDIFSRAAQQETYGKEPREYLPILADWNADDYGKPGQFLDFRKYVRWTGKVKSYEATFGVNDKGLPTAETVSDVRYEAWGADGDPLVKEGTLELSFSVYETEPGVFDILLEKGNLTVD